MTLAVLNMFDHGIIQLIQGPDIDQPQNAITLTLSYHRHFGNFEIFFEAVQGSPHTYQIHTFLPSLLVPGFPITRSLYLTENRNIDPPLPRFLAVHAAIARILHLSGAGEYIQKLLDDLEEKVVQVDGSTELGRLVTLSLGGWLQGIST